MVIIIKTAPVATLAVPVRALSGCYGAALGAAGQPACVALIAAAAARAAVASA